MNKYIIIKTSKTYNSPHIGCIGHINTTDEDGAVELLLLQHSKNCKNKENYTNIFKKEYIIEYSKMAELLYA